MSTTINKPHILVVDDDDRLRLLLRKFLTDQGFLITTASGAQDARRKMEWFRFDLLVLDVMMPGESGFDLLASLPSGHAPVLMLSAMGESEDRIKGLEHGAEDYLTKPFEPKELVLRIRTILRRSAVQRETAANLSFGEFRFNPGSGQLKRSGQSIYLTSTEIAMLRLLAENAGAPVSREELARLMPGVSNERAVDVQVTRLRKKIEESEGKPVYLQTVRGAGYVLYVD